jgi:hypothetical protein
LGERELCSQQPVLHETALPTLWVNLPFISVSLVYNCRASDVQTVICDGQFIMLDRRLLTLDKAKIAAHPNKRIQVHNP